MNTLTTPKLTLPANLTKDDPDSLLVVGIGDGSEKTVLMADGIHTTNKSISLTHCRMLPRHLDPMVNPLENEKLWEFHFLSEPLPGTLVIPQGGPAIVFSEHARPEVPLNWNQVIDDLLATYSKATTEKKPKILEKLHQARAALLHAINDAQEG